MNGRAILMIPGTPKGISEDTPTRTPLFGPLLCVEFIVFIMQKVRPLARNGPTLLQLP
jgi:hypothetical protein